MALYYQDPTYVMLIDEDQAVRIDNAMQHKEIEGALDGATEIKRVRPVEYWSDISRRFLLQHNARFGETKVSYNPYVWRRELIFNTEQDALLFVLKVL